ncbi:MAG: hypothetical protein EU548_10170 [Promethearchaeota archaeon]|nr:MAG: hypothetical protein EU548_10170 [Candidatus Lokiarchaeota archaeon]
MRCAQALKEKGDACWACGLEIKVLEKKKDVVEKIKQLEKRLESLKGTIKNLDESFFSGAINQKEYATMKDPIAHKITKILSELEKLRE